MEAMTMTQFRSDMAAAFNRVDAGQRVVLRRRNRLYALTPVDSELNDGNVADATKNEILSSINRGLNELKLAQEGILTPTSAQEFLKELRND